MRTDKEDGGDPPDYGETRKSGREAARAFILSRFGNFRAGEQNSPATEPDRGAQRASPSSRQPLAVTWSGRGRGRAGSPQASSNKCEGALWTARYETPFPATRGDRRSAMFTTLNGCSIAATIEESDNRRRVILSSGASVVRHPPMITLTRALGRASHPLSRSRVRKCAKWRHKRGD